MKHNNTAISKATIDIFKLKGEAVDTNVVDTIQPVITIPYFEVKCVGFSALNSTGSTIFTTSSVKDTYIIGATMSVCKDVTSTSTLSAIYFPQNGVNQPLLFLATLTLTAQNDTISTDLLYPVKVDKSAAVTYSNTTNVANCKLAGIVYYIEVE